MTSAKFKSLQLTAPIALDLLAVHSPLETTLHTVIVAGGPGSWKEIARWDEYVFTFENKGDSPLVVESIGVVDFEEFAFESGDDPWKLELASKDNWKRYSERSADLINGTDISSAAWSALNAYSLARGVSQYEAALYGGGSGTLALMPYFLVLDLTASQVVNIKAKNKINKEFARRRLNVPVTVDAGGYVSGCLFFPQTLNPISLEIKFRYDNRSTAQSIDLQPLHELNMVPVIVLKE